MAWKAYKTVVNPGRSTTYKVGDIECLSDYNFATELLAVDCRYCDV